MQAQAFFRTVTMDQADLMDELVRRLEESRVPYCVIGGQGVNAYVEPLVSLDLDLVVASASVDQLLAALPRHVAVGRVPHSINLSAADSGLRIQLQLDPRYAEFPARATERLVLGRRMRVADARDLLSGKIWAALDPARRASKRQKDLADIARLLERYPEMRVGVPQAILDRLV